MEQKVAIIVDSGFDLGDELLAQYDIRMIPLRIVYSDGDYRDREDISNEQVYDRLPEEVPKTSLPSTEDILSLYDSLADEGYTHAIHMTISSGLSGTFGLISLLASQYTRMDVIAHDTKTLSMHAGVIALECARVLRETNDIAATLKRAVEVRENSIGMFVIRTLKYLRKGGRIGAVEERLGTLLGICPVITVNDAGVYVTLSMGRNYTAGVKAMIKALNKRFAKTRISIAVVHGAAKAEAERLMTELRELMNVSRTFISQVSPVLGVHTGPGLLGIIAYAEA